MSHLESKVSFFGRHKTPLLALQRARLWAKAATDSSTTARWPSDPTEQALHHFEQACSLSAEFPLLAALALRDMCSLRDALALPGLEALGARLRAARARLKMDRECNLRSSFTQALRLDLGRAGP